MPPLPTPKAREELVEWFRQRGYFAQPRDYLGLGGVYVARQPADHGDVTVLDQALFLVPQEGRWSVVVTRHGEDVERFEFEELGWALDAALKRLARPPAAEPVTTPDEERHRPASHLPVPHLHRVLPPSRSSRVERPVIARCQ